MISPIKSNSFFVFGARGTGKSTWVRQEFLKKNVLLIDLLKPEIEELYRKSPEFLEKQILSAKPAWVILDEVQRLPKLLNLVHSLIESHKVKFILTGSSGRKLKRGQGNLLAGRAFVNHLYPLTTLEMASSFDLDACLKWGSLPKILGLHDDLEKAAYLKAYALTYLREEIQMEQIIRRLDPFRDFLEIAAAMSGCIINYNKIAKDVGCDIKTVQSYYQILEDTWLGFFLPAFHTSIRKSQRLHPKFYIFDPGVKKALERSLDSPPVPGTSAYGDAFESWVILEFFRLNEYYQKNYKLSYFQTHQGAEIDLVLSKPKKPPVLIEIKSSRKIDEIEVNKLARLAESFNTAHVYYLSCCEQEIKYAGVQCLMWQTGLKKIFETK